MTTAYRLDFFDRTGSLRAQLVGSTAVDGQGHLSGFRNLAYTQRVNSPGMLQFVLRGDHEILNEIEDKWLVEVWRKPEEHDWYRDFIAIFRQPEWSYSKSPVFVGKCPGLVDILGWEDISWPADTTNRTRFIGAPAETIAKTIVQFNRGADATEANGRKANSVYSGLSVQTDGSGGNNLDYFCFGKNVLGALQEVASVGGGDFDLIRIGATAYEFRWYAGQRGQDLSGQVVFSVDRHNMADVRYREKRLEEATIAYVWGQGDKDDRDCVVVTSPNYSSGNHHAITVVATDIEKGNTAALQARGQQKLREIQAGAEFGFSTIQQPGSEYGVDYGVGDLVAAINLFLGDETVRKVLAATISFDGKREKITPEFGLP